MIKLFSLKKEKDEASAAMAANGGVQAKKTSASELRAQKGWPASVAQRQAAS